MGGAAGSGGASGGPGGVVRRGVYGEHGPQHVAEAQLRHPHLAILPAGPERRRGERTGHARSARRRTRSNGRRDGLVTPQLPRPTTEAHQMLISFCGRKMLMSCLTKCFCPASHSTHFLPSQQPPSTRALPSRHRPSTHALPFLVALPGHVSTCRTTPASATRPTRPPRPARQPPVAA